MAIITRMVAGFYVDGTSEVFVRYDDVLNILLDVIVRGNSDRLVEVTLEDNSIEVAKNRTSDATLALESKAIRYRLPGPEEEAIPGDTPRIVCTWYKPSVDVIPDKGP